MRTNIVLIDAENVQPDSIERLKHDHFRVYVFVGANQKRIDLSVARAVHSLGANGDYIQISKNGPNALDFHIAYYIGKLAAAIPDAYFHVISKDTGYDALIEHLRTQEICCTRSESVRDIPLLRALEKRPPKERAELFFKTKILSSTARPATIRKLKNAVNAYFQKSLAVEDIDAAIEQLRVAGRIVISGQKVSYPESA